MAKPEIYDLLGIPSENEAQTRSVLNAPPSNYSSYYRGIESRRAPSAAPRFPQRALSAREWEKAQQQANYEQEARRAIQGLSSIEVDDPDFMTKQEALLYQSPYGRELVKDPRVTGLIKNRTSESLRLQKQFQEDPESQVDYILARREGADPRSAFTNAQQASELRKNRLWFAEKGGNVEDFDSGKFIQNGRFDRAAAQSYLNDQTKAKKDASKPWQERLSFKEGEAIREAGRAARDLTDFEEEFAQVQKDNPTLTRDAYVKQFKNAPDFNTYRANRMASTGDQLMREYGLSREEAATVLGIPAKASEASPTTGPAPAGQKGPEAMFEGIQGEPSTIAPTFEGRKETGVPSTAPATAPAGPVSAADLNRVEPLSFESLSQQIAQKGEADRKAREEEYLSRQKVKEQETAADSALWEGAKTKILQGLTPELVQSLSASPNEEQMTEIFRRAGINPETPAFSYPAVNGIPGRDVSWNEALIALAQDPRIAKLQNAESATPARKSFSSLWGGK